MIKKIYFIYSIFWVQHLISDRVNFSSVPNILPRIDHKRNKDTFLKNLVSKNINFDFPGPNSMKFRLNCLQSPDIWKSNMDDGDVQSL